MPTAMNDWRKMIMAESAVDHDDHYLLFPLIVYITSLIIFSNQIKVAALFLLYNRYLWSFDHHTFVSSRYPSMIPALVPISSQPRPQSNLGQKERSKEKETYDQPTNLRAKKLIFIWAHEYAWIRR